MKLDEKEISEFIKASLQGIRNGISSDNFALTESIKFNLAVITIKEGGGGFKIHVVDAGGKYRAEEITKIEFQVTPTDYV
jgi:hypothetical protein